jgi:hypothetical protein
MRNSVEADANPFDEMLLTIAEWHNYHKKTSPGTTAKLRKRFEQYNNDYLTKMIEYHRTKRPFYLSRANATLAKAQEEFSRFKRLEFLATLSK